tara:strand:+ start:52 stop:510 length:459 start_codon:yes stop_codon:yes gene_type:complete
MDNKIAIYNVSDHLSSQIKYFQKNKGEYQENFTNGFDDRSLDLITDKEISDYFFSADSEEHHYHWEDFLCDLEEEFKQYIGKVVSVEGRNMGWDNRSGYKTFQIESTEDIFRQIAPECDLIYEMKKVNDKEYEVRISHHDSPMGEYYNLKIK